MLSSSNVAMSLSCRATFQGVLFASPLLPLINLLRRPNMLKISVNLASDENLFAACNLLQDQSPQWMATALCTHRHPSSPLLILVILSTQIVISFPLTLDQWYNPKVNKSNALLPLSLKRWLNLNQKL